MLGVQYDSVCKWRLFIAIYSIYSVRLKFQKCTEQALASSSYLSELHIYSKTMLYRLVYIEQEVLTATQGQSRELDGNESSFCSAAGGYLDVWQEKIYICYH